MVTKSSPIVRLCCCYAMGCSPQPPSFEVLFPTGTDPFGLCSPFSHMISTCILQEVAVIFRFVPFHRKKVRSLYRFWMRSFGSSMGHQVIHLSKINSTLRELGTFRSRFTWSQFYRNSGFGVTVSLTVVTISVSILFLGSKSPISKTSGNKGFTGTIYLQCHRHQWIGSRPLVPTDWHG